MVLQWLKGSEVFQLFWVAAQLFIPPWADLSSSLLEITLNKPVSSSKQAIDCNHLLNLVICSSGWMETQYLSAGFPN